jgi:hypothetical protein
LNAHFCGAFREWVGASQTTAGRSFQGKQRSRYYRVETQLADARPVSFSLGEWCRRTGFSANTACGKMLLERRGSKRSGARGHGMQRRTGCRLKARYCGGGPCQPAGLRP